MAAFGFINKENFTASMSAAQIKIESAAHQQAPKRTVLGILNTNSVRSHPNRSGKQHVAATVLNKKADKLSLAAVEVLPVVEKQEITSKVEEFVFSVHDDYVNVEDEFDVETVPRKRDDSVVTYDECENEDSENVDPDPISEKPAKKGLSTRPPLQEIEVDRVEESDSDADVDDDSPMVVDTSLKEPYVSPKKKAKVSELVFNVECYQADIYKYLRELELRTRPRVNYMSKQQDISFTMRAVLVDWLVEVAEEYKLSSETLHLAVIYVDRFLSYMSVVRGKLQLVGTAAMFIAAKYQEIYPPDVGEFVYITDDTYVKSQVLRMEHLILKVLSFDLSVPTALCFLEMYCLLSGADDVTLHLAMYLSELSLLDGERFLQFVPSTIGASSLYLSRHTQNMRPWNEVLERVSNYKAEDLSKCVSMLYRALVRSSVSSQQAVREKYKSEVWNRVALLSPPDELPF